jgi:hypothetical protein
LPQTGNRKTISHRTPDSQHIEVTNINITCYDDLITVAKQQPEPQRLLFVFAKTELPDDSSKVEIERFNAGHGGAITPVMCVDKALNELSDFKALFDESQQMGAEWQMVLIAAMSGRGGIMPTPEEADQPLQMMVESIKGGMISNFLVFDREGVPVQFE